MHISRLWIFYSLFLAFMIGVSVGEAVAKKETKGRTPASVFTSDSMKIDLNHPSWYRDYRTSEKVSSQWGLLPKDKRTRFLIPKEKSQLDSDVPLPPALKNNYYY